MISLSRIINKIFFFTNKYYKVISAILVIIILTSSYFIFFQEEISEIQKVGVVDYQEKLNEKKIKENNLVELEEIFSKYQKLRKDEIEKLDIILPEEINIPSLYIQLEEWAEDIGLVLSEVSIGEKSASTPSSKTLGSLPTSLGLKSVAISLSVHGIDSYEKLKLFLNSIEENIRILDVNSITYSQTVDIYNLNLTTYYKVK